MINDNISIKINTISDVCYKLTNNNLDIELCKIIVKMSHDILENHPVANLMKKFINIFYNENGIDSIPISWKIQRDIERLEYENEYHYILLLYYSNCKYYINDSEYIDNDNNITQNKRKLFIGCWYIISEDELNEELLLK